MRARAVASSSDALTARRRRFAELRSLNTRSLPALLKRLRTRLPEPLEEAEAVLALLANLSDAAPAEAATEAAPELTLSVPPALKTAVEAATAEEAIEPDAEPLGAAMLRPASAEQAAVVQAFVSGTCNAVVNAVAGSGKTTCILHAALVLRDAAPGSRVLVLTYNARLKLETRRKVLQLGLESDVDVHSFHAFAVRHYSRNCHTDTAMLRVVDADEPPQRPFSFDRIVVDESQDLTPLFFRLVCKAMRDNAQPCPILLLGDARQNVYSFKYADARYLTLAPSAFAGVVPALPWRSLSLSTTFRLSGNMVAFANAHVLHRPHFNTPNAPGDKVHYYRGNPFEIADLVADKLILSLSRRELQPADIFVLSPSVRTGKAASPTPLNLLENALVRAGCPCFSSVSDDARLDDDVIRDKAVFCTFHSSKGLERKAVVVFSFSHDYFTLFFKDADYSQQRTCPNALYVALTRATHTLYLVGEAQEGGALPFLTRLEQKPYLHLQTIGRLYKRQSETAQGWSVASVGRLTRFLTDAAISEAMRFVRTKVVEKPLHNIPVPLRIAAPTEEVVLMEDVSELNGLAVPAFYESKTTGKLSSMQRHCIEELAIGDTYHAVAKRKPVSMADYLQLAAVYGYVTAGFQAKTAQIKDYDWLTPDLSQPMLDIIAKHLGGEKVAYEDSVLLTAEKLGSKTNVTKFSPMEVTGRIDAVTAEFIYEMKCTSSIEAEHVLQLALYGWLWNSLPAGTGQACAATHGPRQLRLLNFRTGELLQLTSSPAELAQAARVLVEEYLRGDPDISDAAFLQGCKKHRAPFLMRAT